MAPGAKTGGRTKGTPNKRNQQLIEAIQRAAREKGEKNWHPVVAMARVALDESNPIEIRLSALKEVAKYVAPQLKAIEFSTGDNDAGQFLFNLILGGDKGEPVDGDNVDTGPGGFEFHLGSSNGQG